METNLELPGSDLDRLDGLKDALDREEVCQVADDSSAEGERPPGIPYDPDKHLEDAEEGAKVEARVDDKLELLLAALLQ